MNLSIDIYELNETELEALAEMFYKIGDIISCDLCHRQIAYLNGWNDKQAGEQVGAKRPA